MNADTKGTRFATNAKKNAIPAHRDAYCGDASFFPLANQQTRESRTTPKTTKSDIT